MFFNQITRRSARYLVFVGVLSGSIVAGTGAWADTAINNQVDLEAISSYLSGDYYLGNSFSVAPTSNAYYIAGTFTGTFDGRNQIISGLTKPLFNVIGAAANLLDADSHPIDTIEIKDLNLIASNISGKGALANAVSSDVTIDSVTFVGNVNGGVFSNVGGLVGENSGLILNSNVTGTVTGTDIVGGLVGLALGNISDSTFTGSVTGDRYVGGLVGGTGAPTISNSSASGSVTGRDDGEGNIGGLVGGGSLTIINSHSDATVTGGNLTQNIGGLLGYGDVSVSISNSYSTGAVTGDINVGGLVGKIAGSFIEESYSTSIVHGSESVGGLVGYADKGIYQGSVRGVESVANETEYCESPSSSCLSSEIIGSYSSGDVTADNGRAGGLVGQLYSGAILNSYSTSNVQGGTVIGGLVGRVFSYGENSYLTYGGNPFENFYGLVENSYATGTINYSYNGGNRIGGLVGILNGGKIVNSYATAGGLGIDASGGCDHIGGLVGDGSGFEGLGSDGIIQDSFARIEGNISAGCGQVGGLAGSMGNGSTISNSFAYVGGSIIGGDYVGGLVGILANGATVTNSYAVIEGGIHGGDQSIWGVGGLVGNNSGDVENSYATGDVDGQRSVGGLIGYNLGDVENSYATGVVSGLLDVGGLVGYNDGGVANSYATGDVSGSNYVGGLIGFNHHDDNVGLNSGGVVNSYATGVVSGWGEDRDYFGDLFGSNEAGEERVTNSPPEITFGAEVLGDAFGVDTCLNSGLPYLVSLVTSYNNICPSTPSTNRSFLRELRKSVELSTVEKVEKTLGFEGQKSLPKEANIVFVGSDDKIEISKIVAAEIALTSSLQVSVMVGEALQISLKSESKESVELWVNSPDGTWLLAGVITFDKDGKAILPALQFKDVGDYLLALSAPNADSALGNMPMNRLGSLLVSVR